MRTMANVTPVSWKDMATSVHLGEEVRIDFRSVKELVMIMAREMWRRSDGRTVMQVEEAPKAKDDETVVVWRELVKEIGELMMDGTMKVDYWKNVQKDQEGGVRIDEVIDLEALD